MTEITFFTHNLKMGGAQRIIVNLANELVSRGRDVEIVLLKKQGELVSQTVDEVSVVDLETEPFIQAVSDLRTYLRQHRPDTLLSTINTANLIAALAIKTTRTHTEHVVRVASTLSIEEEKYDERLTDLPIPYLMKLLYPRVDQIVAVSEGLASDLIENFSVEPQRIKVIYNPTVTDDLLKRKSEPVSHPWLEPELPNVVLGVGRLTKQKDFLTLLRAFSLLDKEQDTKLLILGEGSKRQELEQLSQKLGIEDDVSLHGSVPNPYPYMAHADLFVLSSRWEGCPNVLIEAMACGCPVVSTDCPHGPREILKDGQYGPLVPVGDPETLSKEIKNVLDAPTDENLLHDRSDDFHIDNIIAEYEQLL